MTAGGSRLLREGDPGEDDAATDHLDRPERLAQPSPGDDGGGDGLTHAHGPDDGRRDVPKRREIQGVRRERAEHDHPGDAHPHRHGQLVQNAQ